MNIMNLIHDICLTKNKIINTPKWRLFERYKQSKRLNEDTLNFLNLDIFNASENMITFLLSLDRKIIENNIKGFITYDTTFLVLLILGDTTNTYVYYHPKFNRFEITNDNVAYTIYRNSKISTKINKMWEPLTHKIKERYLEIIIQIAEYISQN